MTTKLEQIVRKNLMEWDYWPPDTESVCLKALREVIELIKAEMREDNPEHGLKTVSLIPLYEFLESLDREDKPEEAKEG